MSKSNSFRFPKAQLISDPNIKSAFFEDDLYHTGCLTDTTRCDILSPDKDAVDEFTEPLTIEETVIPGHDGPEHVKITITRTIQDDLEGEHLPETDLLLHIMARDNNGHSGPVTIEFDIDPKISEDHRHVFTFSSIERNDNIIIHGRHDKVTAMLYANPKAILTRLNPPQHPNQMLVTDTVDQIRGLGTHIQRSDLDNMLNNLGQPLVEPEIDITASAQHRIDMHTYQRSNRRSYALVIMGPGESHTSQYKISGIVTIH